MGVQIATFGFLEEVLGKAIFALSATQKYKSDEIDAAYEKWIPQLERVLSDPLGKLAAFYVKLAANHQDLKMRGHRRFSFMISIKHQPFEMSNVMALGENQTQKAHQCHSL